MPVWVLHRSWFPLSASTCCCVESLWLLCGHVLGHGPSWAAGRSAPAPAAPHPLPSSWTLVFSGLFLALFFPCSHTVFCPFLSIFSLRCHQLGSAESCGAGGACCSCLELAMSGLGPLASHHGGCPFSPDPAADS